MKMATIKCNATGGLSILNCDDPTKYSHATIVFQPSTADINDPKFKQGKTYYFISKCHCFFKQLFKSKEFTTRINMYTLPLWILFIQKVPSCLNSFTPNGSPCDK